MGELFSVDIQRVFRNTLMREGWKTGETTSTMTKVSPAEKNTAKIKHTQDGSIHLL
jgi:hypothetical protein